MPLSWLRKRKRPRSAASRPASDFRPWVEQLEARLAPATLDIPGTTLTFTLDAGAVPDAAVSSAAANMLTFNAGAGHTVALTGTAAANGFTAGGQTSTGSFTTATAITRINIVGGGGLDTLTINSLSAAGALPGLNVANTIQTTQLNTGAFSTQNIATNSVAINSATTTLTGATSITTGTNGVITFAGTVDGGQTLGLTTTGTGAISFGGAVGSATPLASVSLGGPAALNGGVVRTSGAQTYNAAVTLGAATTLTSNTGGNITFVSTVNGGFSLTTSTTGTTTFGGAVGNTAGLKGLSVSGAGGTTVINGGSINTVNGGGFVQNYNNNVFLGGNTTLTCSQTLFNANLTLGPSPTTATDTLTLTGTFVLAAATTLTTTFAGTGAAQFGHVVSFDANYRGATLAVNYAFTPIPGNTFTVVSNAGPALNSFSNAPAPGPDNLGGINYNVTYAGGAGSNFVLTAAAQTAPGTVYVDSNWTSAAALAASDPIAAAPGPLVLGTNAFADIASGVAAVPAGGSLVVFASSTAYNLPVNFNKALSGIQFNVNSTTAAQTTVTITGAVTLSVPTTFLLTAYQPPGANPVAGGGHAPAIRHRPGRRRHG